MLKRILLSAALVLAGAIAGTALHTALTKGDTVFAGKRPTDLGVTDVGARTTTPCYAQTGSRC